MVTHPTDRVVVLNPASGTGDHTERVHRLAREYDATVVETEGEGDAVELAAAAARDGAELVAGAGGDGTLNEVVRGLLAAEATDDVVFGVIPTGTGNNFAGNIGVGSIEEAFAVIDEGEQRTIDLGVADDRPFLNSCVGGLTAEASQDTTPSLKADLGVVAYVLNTVRQAVDFEGTPLRIETDGPGHGTWEGTALLLLVGNGRRFPTRGQTQADMEDGLLDVAIIEDPPRSEVAGLARSAAVERLLGGEGDHVTRLKAPGLTVRVDSDDPATFSLDGEMLTTTELHVQTRPETLRLRVGDQYDPHPG